MVVFYFEWYNGTTFRNFDYLLGMKRINMYTIGLSMHTISCNDCSFINLKKHIQWFWTKFKWKPKIAFHHHRMIKETFQKSTNLKENFMLTTTTKSFIWRCKQSYLYLVSNDHHLKKKYFYEFKWYIFSNLSANNDFCLKTLEYSLCNITMK